jgi:hypothetical protein
VEFFKKSYRKQQAFYVLLALYGVTMLYLLVDSVRTSDTFYAVLAVIFAGPALLIPLRIVELRKLQLPPSKGKLWFFGLGEIIAVCGAAAFAAQGWVRMQRGGWMYSNSWVVLSVVFGLIFATVLIKVDGRRFRRLGAGDMLPSPVKVARDFGTRMVYLIGLFCVGAPLLFGNLSGPVVGLMVCVGVRLWLGVRDRRLKVDPSDRYKAWDPEHFCRL